MNELTKQYIRDFFTGAKAWNEDITVLVEDTIDGGADVTLQMPFESSSFTLPPDWHIPTIDQGMSNLVQTQQQGLYCDYCGDADDGTLRWVKEEDRWKCIMCDNNR